MNKQITQAEAIKMAEKAAKLTGDKLIANRAAVLKRKLHQKPLRNIIAKIEAASWSERARILGVSRQAMHRWFSGTARPNDVQARKIAELTGVAERVIRGV